MATFNTLFSTNDDYVKQEPGSSSRTYEGTITLISGLTQKNNQTFPLLHAADIQVGQDETYRVTDKFAFLDNVLRDIYGVAPATLEGYGLASLSAIAATLDNSTATISSRITALRAFKTLAVTTTNDAVIDLAVTGSANVVADSNADTATFAAGNKWIKLKGTADSDTVTFGHLVQEITTATSTADLNNSGTFDIELLTYDEAGHITKNTTKTFTLPYNWKSITTSNSTAVTALTTSDSTISAASQIDTVTISASNKWIALAATNKTVNIAHALSTLSSGAHASNFTLSAQSPIFGGTFNILVPSVSFTTDAAGHVTAYSYSSTSATVTIPQGSLTDTDTGNVLTGLSLVATSGALTVSRANIGTLAITGYTKGTDKTALAATDTINAALAKLENQIANEADTRSSADGGLGGRLSTIESNYLDKGVASTTYLTQATASTTYLTIDDGLSKQDASATYLTQATASTTYLTIANGLSKDEAAGIYLTQAAASSYQTESQVSSAIQAELNNYNLTLKAPIVTVAYASQTITASATITAGTAKIWLEKENNGHWDRVGSSTSYTTNTNKSYSISENATYRVAIERTYNSQIVIGYSNNVIVEDIT